MDWIQSGDLAQAAALRARLPLGDFRLLFRNGPKTAIVAGLASVLELLKDPLFSTQTPLAFPEPEAQDPELTAWLRDLRFQGELWACPEGRRAGPGEIVLALHGPAPLAPLLLPAVRELLETQVGVATHFSRLRRAAGDVALYEGGAPWASSWDVRAAYLGGARGSARAADAARFGLPAGPSAPPASAPEGGELTLLASAELDDEHLAACERLGARLRALWLLWLPPAAELLRSRSLLQRHGTDEARLAIQCALASEPLSALPLAEAGVWALVASAGAPCPRPGLRVELELAERPIPPAPGLVRVLHQGRLAAALPNLNAIRECALRAAAEAPL